LTSVDNERKVFKLVSDDVDSRCGYGYLLEQERLEWMECNMMECPINHTFKLVGKKFTMLIIRNMIHRGHKRFNQLLEIEEINAKILSARLKEMEKDGLVERKVYSETPVRIEYAITEKGRALEPILNQMSEFSMKYCAKDIFKDGKARKFEQVYGYEHSKKGTYDSYLIL
jgi:DNA-binding HxlR family transcriptional regulator